MFTSIYTNLSQESITFPFEDSHNTYKPGDYVIYKTEDNVEDYAKITHININKEIGKKETIKILRKADKKDLDKIKENKKESLKAAQICAENTKQHNLDMQILKAQYSLDFSRLEFIFTAPSRIDFRDLLKDLVKQFKTKIRLKQIGPRDRAKLIDGYGKCGRKLCCNSYMNEIPPVTMEAARDQNIAHKSTDKLSGICGKLLCCLNYEVCLYNKLKKRYPEVGSQVKYNNQLCTVIGNDVLNKKIKIKTKDDDFLNISIDDIKK